MPAYHYQATNSAGETSLGTLEAESVSQAVARLESQGLSIQAIGEVATPRPAQVAADLVAAEDRVCQELLRQHLTTAIDRASGIRPALRAMVAELPAGRRRRKLASLMAVLESGDAARAVQNFPELADYWIPLLSAAGSPATAAPDAAQTLKKLVPQWHQTEQLNESSRLTFVYVWIVLGATAAVMYLLSTLVIPTYRSVFYDFGLKLRPLTQAVLTLGEWIANGRILLVFAGALVVVAVSYFLLRGLPTAVRQWFGDRYGSLLSRSSSLARFTRFTAELLEAEFPASVAVRLAATASRSPRLSRAATRLAQAFDRGQADVEVARPAIPATVVHSLTLACSSGTAPRLLRELSQTYAERGLARTSWSRGMIEPLAIVLLGLLVGAVVIALFMPLLSLTQSLA